MNGSTLYMYMPHPEHRCVPLHSLLRVRTRVQKPDVSHNRMCRTTGCVAQLTGRHSPEFKFLYRHLPAPILVYFIEYVSTLLLIKPCRACTQTQTHIDSRTHTHAAYTLPSQHMRTHSVSLSLSLSLSLSHTHTHTRAHTQPANTYTHTHTHTHTRARKLSSDGRHACGRGVAEVLGGIKSAIEGGLLRA